eukprot:CAMPEP_0205804704 /NCGR_PEP_ID=MMETSP0205-20121125/7701_1 /ASSEMBLY_ACC=CAM_ASM_000278 /TAXON_ID=36767 /ORGANISM="Euplotes focardii, Strain TN1" /LENGTH=88 /DNA_ID=CAMNT_0053074735 /DNA_START=604 /DNA_END=870 /DNA_ORIENTATION=+
MTNFQTVKTDSQRMMNTGSHFTTSDEMKKSASERFGEARRETRLRQSKSSTKTKLKNQFQGRIKPRGKNAKDIIKKRSLQTRESGRNR